MGTANFNRQFILIDFEDLESPEFLEFVRSPEYSTYLIMRRNVWRSRQPHYMGLHEFYDQGLLACSIGQAEVAGRLGVTTRTIKADVSSLERRGVIRARHTGRQSVYVLGRWVEDEGAYHEHFYVDRLHRRGEGSFPSEGKDERLPNGGEENFPPGVKPAGGSEVKRIAPMNTEANTEANTEKQQPRSGTREAAQHVVVALLEQGVTARIARELVADYDHKQILAQLDMLPYRPRADNPPGVLVKAIREDWAPPPGYESPDVREAREREVREEAERAERWRKEQERTRLKEVTSTIALRPGGQPFYPFSTTRMEARQVWASVLGDLAKHPGADAHVRGTRLLAREGDELIVGAATDYGAEWLNRRLATEAARLLSALGGERVSVRFVGQSRYPPPSYWGSEETGASCA